VYSLLEYHRNFVEFGPADLSRCRAEGLKGDVAAALQQDRQQLRSRARVAKSRVSGLVFDSSRLTTRCQGLRAGRQHGACEVPRAKCRAGEAWHRQPCPCGLANEMADVEGDDVTDDDPPGEASIDHGRDIFEARSCLEHRS